MSKTRSGPLWGLVGRATTWCCMGLLRGNSRNAFSLHKGMHAGEADCVEGEADCMEGEAQCREGEAERMEGEAE